MFNSKKKMKQKISLSNLYLSLSLHLSNKWSSSSSSSSSPSPSSTKENTCNNDIKHDNNLRQRSTYTAATIKIVGSNPNEHWESSLTP
jgi:hypothetical protein